MAGVAELFGGDVYDKSGKEVDLKTHCAGKVVGIYFSAHWCGPCRGFTPVLTKFYNQHHIKKNFEIIFVSSDRDEKSFNDYYNEMPWLKLDFNEQSKNDQISSKYNIQGIPTLILIDGYSGKLLNEDGRGGVQNGKVDDFPWVEEQKPKTKRRFFSCLLM